ncbi:MAG: hypothetical protein WA936_13640, partial [Erythrobacter sp.]
MPTATKETSEPMSSNLDKVLRNPRRRAGINVKEYVKLVPMLAVMVGVLMPPEVRINVLDQNLYAYRVAYLGFTPWLIYTIAKGGLRFKYIDLFILAASSWMMVSFVALYGIVEGAPSGVAVALDFSIPYLIARTTIRSINDFRRLLIVLAPMCMLVAVTLPIEAITQDRFIRDSALAVFGRVTEMPFQIKHDVRWGLLRAMGPFSHQILAGLFFSGLMPLYWFSGIRGWPRIVGFLSGFATLFTLSSAAFLGLLMFLILAAYEFIRRIVVFLTW